MRRLLLFLLLAFPHFVQAGSVSDATGRTVSIPSHPVRVLPAGPPAAVLLLAVAPDLMLGFPSQVSDETRSMLPEKAAALPTVPRLTGKDDQTNAIKALDPDILVFSDRAMGDVLARSDAWRNLRAVRDGHAYVAPSLNRLLGLAWLQGRDAATLASLFSATFYDRVLTKPQLDAVLSGISASHP